VLVVTSAAMNADKEEKLVSHMRINPEVARRLDELHRRAFLKGWAKLGVSRDDKVTKIAVLEEALIALKEKWAR
jgi:hypothetical protein